MFNVIYDMFQNNSFSYFQHIKIIIEKQIELNLLQKTLPVENDRFTILSPLRQKIDTTKSVISNPEFLTVRGTEGPNGTSYIVVFRNSFMVRIHMQ